MPRVYYPNVRAVLSVVFDGFGGDDSAPTIVQVIPRSATVHLNSYKEADTWEMTFDAKLLPFSPELIRALGVEIYAFDAGGVGQDVRDFASEENLLVAGLADNATLRISDSGREFSLSGRDYTALLLDRQWDPSKRLNVGLPIDKVVQGLADEASGSARTGRSLTVEYIGPGQPPGSSRGQERRTKRGKPIKENKSYWDVIYELCLRQGLIAFVRGTRVIITSPQVLTAANAARVRRMIYGRDLESLEVERKIGKERVPQIAVRSYDPKTRKTLEAVFPRSKEKAKTGVGTDRDEVRVYAVPDVTDERVLREIAESTYNALARGEGTTRFTTRDLRDSLDADLMRLRAGDPVTVAFDPFGDVEMRTAGPEQRLQHLLSLGYSRSVAALVAREYELVDQFRAPLYVREMAVNWSVDDGISLDVEAVNFIAPARDDESAQGMARQFALGGAETGLIALPETER